MDAAAGRDLGPDPKRLAGGEAVDLWSHTLESLIRERETLRRIGVLHEVLERNRCAIVSSQQALSRALIARHGPRLGEGPRRHLELTSPPTPAGL